MDTLICRHVLEHQPDDRAALDRIHAVLTPGGRAVMVTHARPSHAAAATPGLPRRYTEPELRSRMEEAGFEVQAGIRVERNLVVIARKPPGRRAPATRGTFGAAPVHQAES
jgi:hypothetical protein